MRLWTLHPEYLDAQGLVALWREALLAREVLRGRTQGYRHHPQLQRFRSCGSPRSAINRYLAIVWAEAQSRGYKFDRTKLGRNVAVQRIPVTDGQLQYEWRWLLDKLRRRTPIVYRRALEVSAPKVHPLFKVVSGPVAEWENVPASAITRSGEMFNERLNGK
jgi:Pyrimidine dimer DNA glycosylase